jgi:hypothetical protein
MRSAAVVLLRLMNAKMFFNASHLDPRLGQLIFWAIGLAIVMLILDI